MADDFTDLSTTSVKLSSPFPTPRKQPSDGENYRVAATTIRNPWHFRRQFSRTRLSGLRSMRSESKSSQNTGTSSRSRTASSSPPPYLRKLGKGWGGNSRTTKGWQGGVSSTCDIRGRSRTTETDNTTETESPNSRKTVHHVPASRYIAGDIDPISAAIRARTLGTPLRSPFHHRARLWLYRHRCLLVLMLLVLLMVTPGTPHFCTRAPHH